MVKAVARGGGGRRARAPRSLGARPVQVVQLAQDVLVVPQVGRQGAAVGLGVPLQQPDLRREDRQVEVGEPGAEQGGAAGPGADPGEEQPHVKPGTEVFGFLSQRQGRGATGRPRSGSELVGSAAGQ